MIGPRARKYEENLRHLGGLIILDSFRNPFPIPTIITYILLAQILSCWKYLEITSNANSKTLCSRCSLNAILQFVEEEQDDPRWTL